MTCQEFGKHIGDYLDHVLEPELMELFSAHAGDCTRCREFLEDVKSRLKDWDRR